MLFHFNFICYRNFCIQTVETDQSPRSVSADLDLHCLLWDARYKWVKRQKLYFKYFHIYFTF